MIIAPSILSADFSNLGRDINTVVDAGAQWIHVDVMDGIFVPNITIGPVVVRGIRKATKAFLDCHLMIMDPERYIDDFIKAGADGITVHVEATRHLHRTLSMIRERGLKSGVALNPSTPLDTIRYCLDDIDLVLIMSVNPGFGGQSFITESVERIQEVSHYASLAERPKEAGPLSIVVDGGITNETALVCARAGANVLVSGTYLFSSPNMSAAISGMRESARAVFGKDLP